MVFSSMIYLWLFMPLVLAIYYLSKVEYRNVILLMASFIFYSWGEPKYIILMLITITVNYMFALLLDYKKQFKKIILILDIIFNIVLLGYYKYFNLIIASVNAIGNNQYRFHDIALPVGISFYTFQAMSYVIDLYRGEINVQKNWFKLALYISLFPQLVAGPIVRYKDIFYQIENRKESIEKFSYGIKRFVTGLAKKVIVANSMAVIVDSILEMDISYIGTDLSWLVAIAYTVQIYFDFSGYSDMAIGMCAMFGFDICENFDHPYMACSIQDFWRRWHISLSTWFKEYVYIPLGGNRKGNIRTYFNLSIVFLLTGIWHGANYTFIIWGLYHGFFSIIERLGLKNLLHRMHIINRIYTLVVVSIGWVIFRANNLLEAVLIIKNMFIFKKSVGFDYKFFIDTKSLLIMIVAIFLSVLCPYLNKAKMFINEKHSLSSMIDGMLLMGLLIISICLLVNNSYNPFIYFRF